jgi:hypothetical protein
MSASPNSGIMEMAKLASETFEQKFPNFIASVDPNVFYNTLAAYLQNHPEITEQTLAEVADFDAGGREGRRTGLLIRKFIKNQTDATILLLDRGVIKPLDGKWNAEALADIARMRSAYAPASVVAPPPPTPEVPREPTEAELEDALIIQWAKDSRAVRSLYRSGQDPKFNARFDRLNAAGRL